MLFEYIPWANKQLLETNITYSKFAAYDTIHRSVLLLRRRHGSVILTDG